MALTDAELKRLRVLVTPPAWAAHNALPEAEKVNVEDAFEVYGDLRLVAADVLEAACLKASSTAATAPGKRRIKVGPIELERSAAGTVDGIQATTWCALATRLREEASGSGFPGPVFTEVEG
ncbi:hypothetical protein Dcar01_03536 [Deinococcus carri]|uniref:Uncharacterized protein n=1 Tax=Deinococcus carri TaxID=1211323 RepID=A0ABP9WE79_9DEIO